MNKNICVFCGSGNLIDIMYNTLAKNLAEILSKNKNNLVFGGANTGMMRILAENAHKNNMKSIGVVPEKIINFVGAVSDISELHIVKNMYERKKKMAELSDAFIALPGGFGTLEELSEVITHKQLAYHNKPVVIINYKGFFDELLNFFEHLYKTKFAKELYKQLYYVAKDAEDALKYIAEYEAPKLENKW